MKIVNPGVSHDRLRERGLSSLLAMCSLFCGRLPKKGYKNSSWEEDGINVLCLLISQCVAKLPGGGIDSREKIDLRKLLLIMR